MKKYIFIFSLLLISVQALICQTYGKPIIIDSKLMAVPERVTLISPANNFIVDSEELSFFWSSSPAATHYKIELFSDTTNITSVLTIPSISDTTVILATSNYKDKFTKLFWCVSAVNSEGSSVRSEIWTIEFKPALVIEKLPQSISIWPNPMNGGLNVRIGEPLDLRQLSIYDLSGCRIYQTSIDGRSEFSIDATRFPNGELIISMESPDKIYTAKVVK